MNPFNFTGPDFLVFYIGLLVVFIGAVVFFRRRMESGEPSRLDLSDPYLVAYLRGGPQEAIQIAVISLLNRSFLSCQKEKVSLGANAAQELPHSPLERAILSQASQTTNASRLLSNSEIRDPLKTYSADLREHRLLPDAAQSAARRRLFGISAGSLVLIAVFKIVLALARGHTNIGFLIALMIVGIIGTALASFPRLTERGRIALEDLKHLYRGKQGRPADFGSSMALETAMMAAVFGLGALEGDALAHSRMVFPRATNSSVTGGGCGSSCGGGGGGSCGGGGGCGGCGGGH